MKTILASGIGMLFAAAPALALAATSIPIGQSPLQLLTTVAALEAQEAAIQSNQPLACAALFGVAQVAVGQQVALAWGSFGAVTDASSSQPSWTPEGATYVSLDQPGTWTYSFDFSGAGGGSVTCEAKILVTPAQ